MTAKAGEDLRRICRLIDETLEAEKIYLFGSYAYGTPGANSDYDLCVVIPDGTLRPVDAVKKNPQGTLFSTGHAAGCDRVSCESVPAAAEGRLTGT